MKKAMTAGIFLLLGSVNAFAGATESCGVITGPASGTTILVSFLSSDTVSIKVTSSNGVTSQASAATWTPSGINSDFGGNSFSGNLQSKAIILSTHPIDTASEFTKQYGFYSEVTASGIQTSYVSCSLAQ